MKITWVGDRTRLGPERQTVRYWIHTVQTWLKNITNFAALFNLYFPSIFKRVRKICEKRLLASSCLYVCLSVRMEHLRSYYTGFHEIWHFMIFLKCVEKIQVSLKSDINKRVLFNPLAPELFFLISAHPVCKMWIIQEPNKLALWNKLHFEEEKKNEEYRACLKYSVPTFAEQKCNVWRLAVRYDLYISR